MAGAEAAETCLRVLDSAAEGTSETALLEAAEKLQDWAVAPPDLEASVPDGQWFQHVLQLIQQHQQAASGTAGTAGNAGSNGGGGGGGGGSKGKTKRGASKGKRNSGALAASRKAAGPGLQRSVMEWLDSSLDAVLLSEERDVVEWRELHTSPMPQAVFAEILRECEARSGPQLLPIMAPGPNGLACHPSTEPWGQDGAARAALSRMAADTLPPKTSPGRQWPSLELVTRANDAVVAAAAARHEEESSELALFVRELGGVCEGWEDLAAEARGLAKQCVQPFGDKWESLLDSFKDDAQLAKQKYDGNKRASKAAQEVRKLELADAMFRHYEEELKQFGTRWLGLFRTSLEDKVGAVLREDAAWLVDHMEGALERVGKAAKEGESPVIPRVRGATITTLKSWKAASKLIRDQWTSALEALEDSIVADADEFTDATDGEQPAPNEAEEEETGDSGGFIPAGVRLKWEAATADGWDSKCALLNDKDFRRRLRKAESKASACMRAALQLLESLLGVPCGSGGSGSNGGNNGPEDQQTKGPVDQALVTSRKRGSLVSLGAMAVLTTATGLATSLDNAVTPSMMKLIGVSNAPTGQDPIEAAIAEAQAPYREGVTWALEAMDDCIRRSLLDAAVDVARIAPPPPKDDQDTITGVGETFERIEIGVNPAAEKAAQEAAEEKKRREAEKKKKKTAAKNQKRDAERAAQAEAKAKLEAEKRAQAEAERKAAAARKAEAEAQRAKAEAERAQKKKEARDLQRQRRQEMKRQQVAAEKRAAEQAVAEAAAATTAAAVAVVDDLDDDKSMQGRQQRHQSQTLAQPFVPSVGSASPSRQTQQPRASAAAFEPQQIGSSMGNTQLETSSYTPEVLARLDKDLLIQICLQAEEQRRLALAEQLAASDAAAKATSEVAQLRQTVAVLQQAIVSLPQQSMQPHQHNQHQSHMYSGMTSGAGLAPNINGDISTAMGMSGVENDHRSGNGTGHAGMGIFDGSGTAGATAGAIGGSTGVGIGGYSQQSMAQSGYRQW